MRNNVRACLLILLGLTFTTPSHAQSFEDALTQAYLNNPGIKAKRAELRAADETVAKALSFYRPTISAAAGVGRAYQHINEGGAFAGKGTLSPRDVGIQIDQPLFRGFRTQKGVEAAKFERNAIAALLKLQEQNLLLSSAQTYLSILQNAKIVSLTHHNEKVLEKQREAVQNRLKVGEVTKTDLSQAEARLSAAIAERTKAEGDFNNDLARFTRLIGQEPIKLREPQIKVMDLSDTQKLLNAALLTHPAIIAATQAQKAAEANQEQVKGKLLPEVHLVGALGRAWDQGLMLPSKQDNAAIMARLTIPLYSGGADYASIRQAGQTKSQRKLEREEAVQTVREEILRAIHDLQTARSSITAYESQKKATQLALYGVEEEYKVGSRTTLDVLNARQETLQAEVNLVKAHYGAEIATLHLQAALGVLTPETLGLHIPSYDTTQRITSTSATH